MLVLLCMLVCWYDKGIGININKDMWVGNWYGV